jgi:hypothetical protein
MTNPSNPNELSNKNAAASKVGTKLGDDKQSKIGTWISMDAYSNAGTFDKNNNFTPNDPAMFGSRFDKKR